MALYTQIKPTLAGTVYTLANSAASSDQFDNNGAVILHVKNAGASPDSVVIVAQRACEGGTLHNVTVAVTNGTEAIIGPFPPSRFNDNAGRVTVTHSYTTTVTVACINYG